MQKLNNLNKYFTFIKLSAKNTLKNKKTIFGFVLFLGTLLLIYNKIWNVVIIDGIEKFSIAPNVGFTWYLFFTELIILSTPALHRTIEEDISHGTMAYFVNCPINFFMMRFAENVGILSVNFMFLLLCGIGITYLLTSTLISHLHLIIIIILCFITTILNSLIMILIGFCALWFHTTKPTYLVIQSVTFVLGGVVLPLTIYPHWLINIAKYTPFYYMFFMIAKLSYAFNWRDVILIIIMEFFWGSIFSTLIVLAYHQLSRRIGIYGS